MGSKGASVIGEGFASVLAGAQSGAPWALERLYHALAPAVAGYLRVQGCTEADDVTSDVLYRALTGIVHFVGDEPQFRSWVFTIAHNRLVDERRRLARRPALSGSGLEDLAVAGTGNVEDDALRRLGVERVRRLCEQLPPDQRDVLLLRMAAGMTLQETAAALGKSLTAVKALQRRAVEALRKNFLQEGVSR